MIIVTAALNSPDGTKIVSASYDNNKLWNVDSKTIIRTMTGHKDRVTSSSRLALMVVKLSQRVKTL
jgi:WD40 repeat protein